jgi:ABC-type methionine transport system permease subunit
MKRTCLLFVILGLTVIVLGQTTKPSAAASAPQAQQPPPTLASTVDREITTIEKQIVDAAEATPEDKFNFSPES